MTHAPLALGRYNILASDFGALYALMLKLTVQRWWETCMEMKTLLSDPAAKAEKREDDELVGNGDGAGPAIEAGLWTGRDIDFLSIDAEGG